MTDDVTIARDETSAAVLAPYHYRWHPDGIEAVTVAEELPYNSGSAIAYIMRAGRKPNADAIEDLQKAIAHLTFEIERLKRRRNGMPKHAPHADYIAAAAAHDAVVARLDQANKEIARLERRDQRHRSRKPRR